MPRPPLRDRMPGPKWLSRFVRLVTVFGGNADDAVLHDVLDRGRTLFKSGFSASSAAYVVAGEQTADQR